MCPTGKKNEKHVSCVLQQVSPLLTEILRMWNTWAPSISATFDLHVLKVYDDLRTKLQIVTTWLALYCL